MIIANMPIICKGRQYKKGEALPGDSPLVPVWLKNGAAYDDSEMNQAEEPIEDSVEEPVEEPMEEPEKEPAEEAPVKGKKRK